MTDETKPPQSSAPESGGGAAADARRAAPSFRLENILIKNLSLETPASSVAPALGKNPTIKIEMRNAARRLSRENYYEVTLDATCRMINGEETSLLVEATQAGVFVIENADASVREQILNIHAPEMLYPYICQLACDLFSRAGAPRLFLPPFNFRALYEQKRRALEQKLAEENSDKTSKAS